MIRLGTFFSGIGAPEMTLKKMGIEYNLKFFCEIDKNAIKAYKIIHEENGHKNLFNIKTVNGELLPYCDVWVGGFPCQDISKAGNLNGFDQKDLTRSSLGWEMIRLLKEVKIKPRHIIFENVKNITSKRFKETLDLFKKDLVDLGYNIYDSLLNAKNYGINQNRDRYFLIATIEENFKFNKEINYNISINYYLDNKPKYIDHDFEFENGYYKVPEAVKAGYTKAYVGDVINLAYPKSKTRRGRVQKNIIPTLTTKNYFALLTEKGLREISLLEKWRLMGFSNRDFNKIKGKISDNQIEKLIGNSIVLDVLESIFKNLF